MEKREKYEDFDEQTYKLRKDTRGRRWKTQYKFDFIIPHYPN